MLKAVPGKLVLKLDPAPEKTAGGLYLPDDARDKAQTGTIVDCCDLSWFEGGGIQFNHFQKGQKVVIGKYGGYDVAVETETYVVIKSLDVLATLDPAPVGVSLEHG